MGVGYCVRTLVKNAAATKPMVTCTTYKQLYLMQQRINHLVHQLGHDKTYTNTCITTTNSSSIDRQHLRRRHGNTAHNPIKDYPRAKLRKYTTYDKKPRQHTCTELEIQLSSDTDTLSSHNTADLPVDELTKLGGTGGESLKAFTLYTTQQLYNITTALCR